MAEHDSTQFAVDLSQSKGSEPIAVGSINLFHQNLMFTVQAMNRLRQAFSEAFERTVF